MKEIIAKYDALKTAKSMLEEKIDEIKVKLSEIENELMEKIKSENSDGAIVNNYKIQIKQKRVYSSQDWNMLYGYIMQTQDFSVLQARLSSTRLKEMEKDGINLEQVGVKSTDLEELSVRQIKK